MASWAKPFSAPWRAQTWGHVEIIVAPDDDDTYRQLRERFKSPQLRIIAPGAAPGSGPGAHHRRRKIARPAKGHHAASRQFFAASPPRSPLCIDDYGSNHQ